MTKNRQHSSPFEELFDQFPRGLALLDLKDPEDVSTWRLVSINYFASSVVVPSIDTFLSAEKLGLAAATDVANLYREIITKRRVRTIGIVESRIDELETGTNGAREVGKGNAREFRSARPKRLRVSRRSM